MNSPKKQGGKNHRVILPAKKDASKRAKATNPKGRTSASPDCGGFFAPPEGNGSRPSGDGGSEDEQTQESGLSRSRSSPPEDHLGKKDTSSDGRRHARADEQHGGEASEPEDPDDPDKDETDTPSHHDDTPRKRKDKPASESCGGLFSPPDEETEDREKA